MPILGTSNKELTSLERIKVNQNKEKILDFFPKNYDREDITVVETAEAVGYRTGGSHNFFYALRELKKDKMVRDKRGRSKGRMLSPHGFRCVMAQKRVPRYLRELAAYNRAGEKE